MPLITAKFCGTIGILGGFSQFSVPTIWIKNNVVNHIKND